MTSEQLRVFLNQQEVKYDEKELQHGTQFRCSSGEVFVVYRTGKLVVQGAVSELSKQVGALLPGGTPVR